MSVLGINDPSDPRSHRYYAPRHRHVVAREATLQPVLERLRGSTRDYSAEERLHGDADPMSSPATDFVIVPERRFPFAALAGFAGGATAVAVLGLAYVVFDTNSGSRAAAAVPAAAVEAPATPAKIVARVIPNAPVSPVQPVRSQVASADASAAVPVATAKGDRLDAATNPPVGAAYDPLQSPLSLWGLSPTQAAIEGTEPTLAAPAAPPAAETAAAAPPPHQAAPAHAPHHAAPVRHSVHYRHHVRHVKHWRHHKPATTGEAASTGSGRSGSHAANGSDAAAQPAAKKFLGLFGG